MKESFRRGSKKNKEFFINFGIPLLILIPLILWGVIYISTGPEHLTREDLPPLTGGTIVFNHPAWQEAGIRKICLSGEGEWPSGLRGTDSLSILEDLLGDFGYEAEIGSEDDCGAEMHLSLAYQVLTASYSNGGRCKTGYTFEGSLDLAADGLEPIAYSESKKESPPDTIPDGSCENYYQGYLHNTWNQFMRAALLEIWSSGVQSSVNKAFQNPITACFQEPGPEYLTEVLIEMMDNERGPDGICFSFLEEMGTEAEEAIPYLLYLMDTIDWEHEDDDYMYETLRAVSGEDIGDSFRDWLNWWWEQQEE